MSTTTTTPNAEQAKTAVTTIDKSPLIIELAQEYKMQPGAFYKTMVETVFPHRKDDPLPTVYEVAAFMSVAKVYKLNPFVKEIFAFRSKGGGIVPIVSVDGWITLVQRHPDYNGVSFQFDLDTKTGKPISTTCSMRNRRQEHPTEITEFFDECVQDKDTWKKWPKRMLRHKAYIQCARVAFGFSGIYDEDEGERILQGDVSLMETGGGKVTIDMPQRASQTEKQSTLESDLEAAYEDAKKGKKIMFLDRTREDGKTYLVHPAGKWVSSDEEGYAEILAEWKQQGAEKEEPAQSSGANGTPEPQSNEAKPELKQETVTESNPEAPGTLFSKPAEQKQEAVNPDCISKGAIGKLLAVAKSGRFRDDLEAGRKTTTDVENDIRKFAGVQHLNHIKKENYDAVLAWAGGDKLKIK
jgi:phage recombination protein Bet